MTPPAPAGAGTVEIRATNDGTAWSNALHFTYTPDGASDGASELTGRQLSLLQMFVSTCCGPTSAVGELMGTNLPEPQRLVCSHH